MIRAHIVFLSYVEVGRWNPSYAVVTALVLALCSLLGVQQYTSCSLVEGSTGVVHAAGSTKRATGCSMSFSLCSIDKLPNLPSLYLQIFSKYPGNRSEDRRRHSAPASPPVWPAAAAGTKHTATVVRQVSRFSVFYPSLM